MSNILTIFRKELNSYFNSPIAYLVMAFFGLIAGYFFYVYVAIFVSRSMESQMMGRGMPMDVNEWVIRPLLSNLSVIGLFMIPMITMRLFAEEKRSGTIELLATSPVRDIEVIIGKWLAAVVLYASVLALSGLERRYVVPVRKAGSRADFDRVPRAVAAGWSTARDRYVHFDNDEESDHRRVRDVRDLPAALGARLGEFLRDGGLGEGDCVHVGDHASGSFRQGCPRQQRHHFLSLGHLPRAVPYGALDGIATVEGINETRMAAS